MINPSRPSQKALPAETYIDSVSVDRREIAATDKLKIPPRPRDVQIDYTSPTFLIPQRVKFRYRLDGYDLDWHDAGTRRQAFYTDLPTGKYRFRVIAANSDGVWNDKTAKLDFSVAPEVQGLRESVLQGNDLALAISTLGKEFATDSNHRPEFRVAVEGESRELHPILRDEVYKIAAEALGNAFRHAQARQIEVEIRYDDEQFRLRVRDDGKGIDPAVLSQQGAEGHYGLPGMRERAALLGAKLTVWSEVDAGTEVELRVPAITAYATRQRGSWLSRTFAGNAKA